jgi:CheY-like chemotaxis protein
MFTRDLFFGSKVTGTASAMGLHVELEADIERGLSKLAGGGYRCVILDLAMPRLSPADVVAAVNNSTAKDRPRVIAFGAHVHTARLEEAREAGCDDVMPRSRFSTELAEILSQFCGEPE